MTATPRAFPRPKFAALDRRARGRRGNGQALTEFLVVTTFLLIPLLLLIPVIAGLISQKQDVELAARYAVWERTVWARQRPPGSDDDRAVKSDEQIAREIDARIFSADTEPVTSEPAPSTRLDPFSSRPHDGAALLRERSDADVEMTAYAEQRSSESNPSGLVGVSDDAVSALGSVTRFDLNDRGQFDATVSVGIADMTGWFDLVGVDLGALRISRSSRLFTEAWTGGPKRDVERTISGLLPQQFMDGAVVRNVQDFAAFAPGAREVRSDWLRFGHVDIDPLPDYRLIAPPPP